MLEGSEEKVVVVTGSGRGIGKAIAIEFAKEGYNVVTNSINPRNAEAVVDEIRSLESDALAVGADVSKPDDVKNLMDKSIEEFGRIDVLVNNAGIQSERPFFELSLEDWRRVIDVNLQGVFLCSQAAAKHMVELGGGTIINISSVHQTIPKPHFAHYAASKGGVGMLTKTLALELADKKIRVNAVAPGAIRTDMNKDVLASEAKMDTLLEMIPLRRVGEPEEVAYLATFLASDKARYITGATFFVDGGLTLYPSFCMHCKGFHT